MVKFAGLDGFLLLVLNIRAIGSIFGSENSTGSKVLRTLLISLSPLVCFIVWFIAGPRASKVGC